MLNLSKEWGKKVFKKQKATKSKMTFSHAGEGVLLHYQQMKKSKKNKKHWNIPHIIHRVTPTRWKGFKINVHAMKLVKILIPFNGFIKYTAVVIYFMLGRRVSREKKKCIHSISKAG